MASPPPRSAIGCRIIPSSSSFVWQTYDVAPAFPVLHGFLDHWRREIEATLHSIRVAHQHLIGPAEWRAVDGIITIN